MKEVEKLLKKIRIKLGDKDAKLFWGVEYASDTKNPDYRARIVPSKAGVQPFIAGSLTQQGLIEELQKFLEGVDIKYIAIGYAEAQIKLAEESKRFHEGLIRDYEKLTHSES